ncbi:MAG: hypothetical protein ACOH1Y_15890 [Propionicimonas sp.]
MNPTITVTAEWQLAENTGQYAALLALLFAPVAPAQASPAVAA